jgi:hypothetical protein
MATGANAFGGSASGEDAFREESVFRGDGSGGAGGGLAAGRDKLAISRDVVNESSEAAANNASKAARTQKTTQRRLRRRRRLSPRAGWF